MATKKYSDSFSFLPQGGIIQDFKVGGTNIVLGFPSAESYKTKHSPFFGETIGRVANRISGAKINSLNGKSYPLAVNNGPNTLHGGVNGWGKVDFEGPKDVERNGKEAVLFTYLSKDGDEGFPGTVEFKLWYTPSVENDKSGIEKTSLEIEYEVELVGDEVEETVVAVTNHSYFNISGGPTLEGTQTTMETNLHQVVDDDAIPTGAIEPYPEFEAKKEFTLGAETPKPDHCFVVNTDPSSVPLDTRSQSLQKLCSFYHPYTKLHLEALSTEPAFQFYTGKFIDVPEMDGLPARGPRSGMCIEASRYVDAVNIDKYRSMVLLKKGEVWGSRTVYRAWKD
ncbi:hypothetical protein B0A48_06860 [Cryoendolithus antarcticus]|uniref:Aldose 1-epimerase n=1 Tax=Cryoendolithus antarcticus TaxID=1507870 RepID=A0A1V8T9I1_9PEZI|nr:hypothetical protein B0A48_06860 [Cryoendolithus antarcticus]